MVFPWLRLDIQLEPNWSLMSFSLSVFLLLSYSPSRVFWAAFLFMCHVFLTGLSCSLSQFTLLFDKTHPWTQPQTNKIEFYCCLAPKWNVFLFFVFDSDYWTQTQQWCGSYKELVPFCLKSFPRNFPLTMEYVNTTLFWLIQDVEFMCSVSLFEPICVVLEITSDNLP